jgi:hypothetical protein
VFFKEMFFLQQMGCVPPKEWPFPWGQVCWITLGNSCIALGNAISLSFWRGLKYIFIYVWVLVMLCTRVYVSS